MTGLNNDRDDNAGAVNSAAYFHRVYELIEYVAVKHASPSCAATFILLRLRLYLTPSVYTSSSRSLFQVFLTPLSAVMLGLGLAGLGLHHASTSGTHVRLIAGDTHAFEVQ